MRRPSGLSSVAALDDSLSIASIKEDSNVMNSALDTDEELDSPLKPTSSDHPIALEGEGATEQDIAAGASRVLGRRMSDYVFVEATGGETPAQKTEEVYFKAEGEAVVQQCPESTENEGIAESKITHLKSPTDLAAQLFANPKLTALRSQPLTPGAQTSPSLSRHHSGLVSSAPILTNPQCSGYFVEPVSNSCDHCGACSFMLLQMKWMEHFLSAGQLAGKITCPNKKCGAKLGNYDWAGFRCGCNQWVAPVSIPAIIIVSVG